MELTRRNFLKGALAGGAMAGASAALASCAPQGSGEAASESSASAMTAESYADMKWSFEIAPDPVSEDETVETITHDVVIVGAGMAGLCTACAAAEKGRMSLCFLRRASPSAVADRIMR